MLLYSVFYKFAVIQHIKNAVNALQGFSYFLSRASHPELGSVVSNGQPLLFGAAEIWNKMKNDISEGKKRKKRLCHQKVLWNNEVLQCLAAGSHGS